MWSKEEGKEGVGRKRRRKEEATQMKDDLKKMEEIKDEKLETNLYTLKLGLSTWTTRPNFIWFFEFILECHLDKP